jgi:hypothetical protein
MTDERPSAACVLLIYGKKGGDDPADGGTGASPSDKGRSRARITNTNPVSIYISEHSSREGEAPRAWLVEGATQAPLNSKELAVHHLQFSLANGADLRVMGYENEG